jgi:hypothetical protein
MGFESLFGPEILGGHAHGVTPNNNVLDAGAAIGSGVVSGVSSVGSMLGGLIGGFGEPVDWKGAGFGAGMSASQPNGNHADGGFGFGGVGGANDWSMMDGGTSRVGESAGGGVFAPMGFGGGSSGAGFAASTTPYAGAGGSAYSFDNGAGSTGVGLSGSAVPLGMMDTNFGASGGGYSANEHVDNAFLGKVSGSATAGTNGANHFGSATGSVQSGVEGVNGRLATPNGSFTGAVGSLTDGANASVDNYNYNSATGAANAAGSFNVGVNGSNLSTGYSSSDGTVQQNTSVERVSYGVQGHGSSSWDPTTGTFNAQGEGRGGGVAVQNANSSGSVDGVGSYNAHLGEFSNDVTVKNATATVDGQHAHAGADVDGLGLRFLDANVNGQLGSGPNAVKGGAHADSLGTNNSLTGATVDANWGADPSLRAGFKDLSFGDWSGTNLSANMTGPGGANANASVGSFSTNTLAAQGFASQIDRNGAAATLKHGQFSDVSVNDANLHAGIGDATMDAHLGGLGVNQMAVDNASAGLTLDKGLYANAASASYDTVAMQNVSVDEKLGGLYQSHLGATEASFDHFSGKNISAGIDGSGAHASLDDGQYSYLAGKDLSLSQSFGGGAVGFGAGAKQASVGDVNIGSASFNTDLESSHLAASNIGAAGVRSQDVHSNANIGALGFGGSAKTMNLADLNVGSVTANTSNFGLTGNADVNNARLDAVNIQGGHEGLSWNGKEQLGVSADVRTGAGLGDANASWDMTHGAAAASFKDASVGGQMSNASVNMFGTDYSLPDVGAKVNASGGANVDLSHGAASANLGLGGSSVNFAGYEATMPDWVKASAGVNLSEGAANLNVGGDNGIGANMNLSKGQFTLDAGGYELDVGQGVRDVGGAISDGAGALADGAGAVGGAIGSAASAVWDWL